MFGKCPQLMASDGFWEMGSCSWGARPMLPDVAAVQPYEMATTKRSYSVDKLSSPQHLQIGFAFDVKMTASL